MKVIIIGSGLIGLTAGYSLKCRGHEVTIIDRAQGAALETSFANGALLTPSMPEPWNAPGCWRVLLSSLGRSDTALRLRLRTLPSIAGWGIKFLKNARQAPFKRNTLSNLRLALYSLEALQVLRQDLLIEYGRAARGSLRILRDPEALTRAFASAAQLSAEGLKFRVLSAEETVELEPALTPIKRQLAGALHYGVDETGDAYRFCVALAERLRDQGVEFAFGTEIASFEMRSRQVIAVRSGRARFVADQYVIAAGSYSTPLLQRLGVHLPVRPTKGYSVTFDCTRRDGVLRIPVVDDEFHAVVAPLDGALRVAGTAEFAGYDLTLSRARIRSLLNLVGKVLPETSLDATTAKSWCGLRAMSADGVPIIGRTPLANLFVSTGHGHLGWTMAAGSAELLSDLLCGNAPSIDPAPYALSRFAAAR